MGYDVVLSVSLKINKDETKKWKSMKLIYSETIPKEFPANKAKSNNVRELLQTLQEISTIYKLEATEDVLTIKSVLGEDGYIDYSLDIAAAINSAFSIGIKGDMYIYGWVTALPGIAFSFESADNIVLKKLSIREENELKEIPRMKEIVLWIDKRVEEMENDYIPKTRKAFYKGLIYAADTFDEMMKFLRDTDDRILVDIMQKYDNFYMFYTNDIKTGKQIKKALRSNAGIFEFPLWAISEMMFMLCKVDKIRAADISLKAINSGKLTDSHLWEVFAEILGQTEYAPLIIEKIRLEESYNNCDKWNDWINCLGTSQYLNREHVYNRLINSIKNEESAVAGIMAAILFLHFKAYEYVDEIYPVIYSHTNWGIKHGLHEVFQYVDYEIENHVPLLETLEGNTRFYELHRRIRIDPAGTFQAIESMMTNKDQNYIITLNATITNIFKTNKDILENVIAKENGFKKYL